MLFFFDDRSIRSDEPSDFFRFLGSDFLSSIPGVLAVQAGTVWKPIVSALSQFADK